MYEERAQLPCKSSHGDDNALLDPALSLKGRYVHIDVTRICCITCIAVNAFDQRFRHWNTLYSVNWVLQFLWLVVGICFGLSERPLINYMRRLALYFVIGLSLNWAAWLINGWDWMHQPAWMVSQMGFVLCLIIFTLLLKPLKVHLTRLAERSSSSEGLGADLESTPSRGNDHGMILTGRTLRGLLLLVAGMLFIIILFACLFDPVFRRLANTMSSNGVTLGIHQLKDTNRAADLGSSCSHYCQTIVIGLWIVLVYPLVFSDLSVITWLLILNCYVHRLVFGYGSGDLPFHGFYLVMMALTSCKLGITWRRRIAKFVQRYWMVIIFTCAFLWTPGLSGPLMHEPPGDMYIRERYVLIEGVLIAAWLTTGQEMIDPKIFTEDNLSWVNEWALLVFLLHQSVRWLMPSLLGWLVLLALGPVCYIFNKVRNW